MFKDKNTFSKGFKTKAMATDNTGR